jgi:hypothetical protein
MLKLNENIRTFFFRWTSDMKNKKANWNQTVEGWFNEQKVFPFSGVDSFQIRCSHFQAY